MAFPRAEQKLLVNSVHHLDHGLSQITFVSRNLYVLDSNLCEINFVGKRMWGNDLWGNELWGSEHVGK